MYASLLSLEYFLFPSLPTWFAIRSIVVVLSVSIGGSLVAVNDTWCWNNGALRLVIDAAVSKSRRGLVARAHIRTGSSKSSRRDRSLKIHTSGGVLLRLSLPEAALLAVAASVVVGRGRSVTLLLLARPDDEDLDQSTEKEKNSPDDGRNEDRLVEAACGLGRYGVGDVAVEAGVGGAAERAGTDVVAMARVDGGASEDSNRDKATHAQKIQDHRDETEEGDSCGTLASSSLATTTYTMVLPPKQHVRTTAKMV